MPDGSSSFIVSASGIRLRVHLGREVIRILQKEHVRAPDSRPDAGGPAPALFATEVAMESGEQGLALSSGNPGKRRGWGEVILLVVDDSSRGIDEPLDAKRLLWMFSEVLMFAGAMTDPSRN